MWLCPAPGMTYFQLPGTNEVVAGAQCLAAFVAQQQKEQGQCADGQGDEALVAGGLREAGRVGFKQAIAVVIFKALITGKMISDKVMVATSDGLRFGLRFLAGSKEPMWF